MTASWWVSQEATEYKVVLRHRPRTLAGSPFDRHEVPGIKLDGHDRQTEECPLPVLKNKQKKRS